MRNFLAALLLISVSTKAQKLSIVPTLGTERIEIGKPFLNKLGQDFSLETVRFYISKIQFVKGKKTIWQEQAICHLMDLEKPNSFAVDLAGAPGTADSLVFYLGIDSAGNVSDKFVGDLDPLKGMYWTWQSGYINCKIEGTSPHCKSLNSLFELHVGGYLGDQATIQRISLPLKKTGEITVYFDLSDLLLPLDIAELNSIMIPGKEAVELSRQLATLFRL